MGLYCADRLPECGGCSGQLERHLGLGLPGGQGRETLQSFWNSRTVTDVAEESEAFGQTSVRLLVVTFRDCRTSGRGRQTCHQDASRGMPAQTTLPPATFGEPPKTDSVRSGCSLTSALNVERVSGPGGEASTNPILVV